MRALPALIAACPAEATADPGRSIIAAPGTKHGRAKQTRPQNLARERHPRCPNPSELHRQPAEAERPNPKFQPLRPPIGGGGAIHPPLGIHRAASMPGPVNRTISVPARTPAPAQPGLSAPAAPPIGPSQPLPAEPAPRSSPRSARDSTPLQSRTARPARRGSAQPETAPASSAPLLVPQQAAQPHPRCRLRPTLPGGLTAAVPGAPIPPRQPPPRPSAPGLTPGAPIAPRPRQHAPLVGQPAARPSVPPRPDMVRLRNSRIVLLRRRRSARRPRLVSRFIAARCVPASRSCVDPVFQAVP